MFRRPGLFTLLFLTVLTSMSVSAYDCSTLAKWMSTSTYHGGDMVKYNNKAYKANWWTHGANPEKNSLPNQVWTVEGQCEGGGVKPPHKDNQLPMIDLTSPMNGESFKQGDSVALSANACDADGSISKVEFFVDNKPAGMASAAPYSATWVATSGSHNVYARATDDKGANRKSETVFIKAKSAATVNIHPVVTLTAPANGSKYKSGETVKLMAKASDKDGTIKKVSFYDNDVLLVDDTMPPYAFEWTAVNGTHKFKAIAVDNQGASSTSETVMVTVGDMIPKPSDSHCRPDGLYQTKGVNTRYCTVYDKHGREKLGPKHSRRIIGYFTGWRNGADGKPAYLVNDIPWDKITHINYAFAHVNDQHMISVGTVNRHDNPATGMEWPTVNDAQMSPEFAYKGHFNLLSKYKKKYPHVKTLIAVGGWAESGGYFNDSGKRVENGGFYKMTTNSDGSINHAGIHTFADSVVDFLRRYGFDGADIDYEYATSMKDAGNPLDFKIANPLRANLMASYVELMKVLREKLDKAGEKDAKHYLLTVAAPASGYLLRGMETYQVTQYLDYLNIMAYDMHGGWNDFVGHNAALYDNGKDVELIDADIYTTSQYGGIGYLNVDWAVKYFRGSLQPGRINIGIPYYTRGWKQVAGGTHGLNGRAALPDQSQCPPGTGLSAKCGYGAIGIDNIWHDTDAQNREIGSGSNPIWHAKNLQRGIMPGYLKDWGLKPESNPDDRLQGSYKTYYDSVAVGQWLWNTQKGVFLSIEDKKTLAKKVQYVIDHKIGGIMIWELAGDYRWIDEKKEYGYGHELTTKAHEMLKSASPYGNRRTDKLMPKQAVDITVELHGFKVGDQNYPINPKLKLTNRSGIALPGGTQFNFEMPTSTPDDISDQSGFGVRVAKSGSNASGNNIGGLKHTFHRLSFQLPNWKTLQHGDSVELTLNYYLPVTGPQAWTVKINGKYYALKSEYPQLPLAHFGPVNDPLCGKTELCSHMSVDTSAIDIYPHWGNGVNANKGDKMIYEGNVYKAGWWTTSLPGSDASWEFLCTVE